MSEPHGTDLSAQVQLIVDLLAQSLDRAVLLDNPAMAPITFSRQRGTVDDVRMHSLIERATKPEVMAELRTYGVDEPDTRGVAIAPFPHHGMVARYCVPIRSASERFGYLWVIDPRQSLTEAEQALAQHAGNDLLALLDRRNANQRAAESAHHALLTRLLSPTEPLDAVLRDLRQENMAEPDDVLTVFAVSPVSAELAGALRLRLATTERTHNWFLLPGSPAAILAVCAPQVRVPLNRLADTVAKSIEAITDAHPTIGWAGRQVPLAGAAQAFLHARLAWSLTNIGAAGTPPPTPVTDWLAMGSWKTVALLADKYAANPTDLDELLPQGIATLMTQGRDDLLHTLEVYLATGGDARRAAEALHLHRSTLYYRLEKITALLGDDLTDGETRFELMLGIRLARFGHASRDSS